VSLEVVEDDMDLLARRAQPNDLFEESNEALIMEVILKILSVVPPRLTIQTRRSFSLQTEIGQAQCFQRVDFGERAQ
jgi:hypothetical protein